MTALNAPESRPGCSNCGRPLSAATRAYPWPDPLGDAAHDMLGLHCVCDGDWSMLAGEAEARDVALLPGVELLGDGRLCSAAELDDVMAWAVAVSDFWAASAAQLRTGWIRPEWNMARIAA